MNAKAILVGAVACIGTLSLVSIGADTPPEETPASIDSMPEGTYVPDGTGGLYVVAIDSLWYARGTRLHQVHVDGEIIDVIPVADGTAYGVGFDQLWHLDGALATPVEKAPDDGLRPMASENHDAGVLFALWQYERRRANGEALDTAPLLGPDPREDPY